MCKNENISYNINDELEDNIRPPEVINFSKPEPKNNYRNNYSYGNSYTDEEREEIEKQNEHYESQQRLREEFEHNRHIYRTLDGYYNEND